MISQLSLLSLKVDYCECHKVHSACARGICEVMHKNYSYFLAVNKTEQLRTFTRFSTLKPLQIHWEQSV